MQLFDLSVISKARNTCGDTQDQKRGMLPPSRNRGNGHYSLPLAMLLYRLANRLSRSQVFILANFHGAYIFFMLCLVTLKPPHRVGNKCSGSKLLLGVMYSWRTRTIAHVCQL